MKIRIDSTEYIYSTVTADHDLTSVTIEVALPATTVTPDTWYSAEVTDVEQTATDPDEWTATYRLLVGPDGGDVELTAGTYDWTFRLTDTPERPIRKTGTVIATTV